MVLCFMAGCSGEKSDTSAKSEQIETLYEARKEWEINNYLLDDESGEEIELEDYAYAVTDLDLDGKYEVLVSGWAGTGHFSHNRVYEYEAPGKSCKWDMDGMECEDSEPDLLLQEEIQGIFGTEDGVVSAYTNAGEPPEYLLLDKEYWGVRGGEIRCLKCVINDNKPNCSIIASMQEDGENEEIRYYNSEGEAITEEKFNELVTDTFEGKKEEKLSIKWFTDLELMKEAAGKAADELIK